jgi:hypothetical protein
VDARLLTLADTSATPVAGLAINWDTTTAFDYTRALVPASYRLMTAYLPPAARGPNGVVQVRPNIYGDTRTGFFIGNATSTYGSGTSAFTLIAVDVGPMNSSNSWSESTTTLYSEAGGATTANAVFDDMNDIGIFTPRGQKLLARLDNSAAMSAVAFRAFGYMQRVPR